MSQKAESEANRFLRVIQELEKSMADTEHWFERYRKLAEDAGKRASESKFSLQKGALLLAQGIFHTHASSLIGERVLLDFLIILATESAAQASRIDVVERKLMDKVADSTKDHEREEMREIYQRNVKALQILEKLLAEQKQIQEREPMNII